MRAAIISRYGEPNVFELVDLPAPTPGDGDVLVDVWASSVNPIDWKIRKGAERLFIRYKLPWVLGLDFSGVVSAVGAGVSGFSEGDEVFGCADYKRPGCYAEQVVVAASALAKKAPSLSHEQAASLPLAGLTAWQCLYDTARVTSGQKVFIQAGSGGVGTLAIQLAKNTGAEVTTTCSGRNAELVTQLGADHVVDYTTTKFAEVVKDQDFVLDSLGGKARWEALACLKRGGHHVSITSDIPTNVGKYGVVLGPIVSILTLAWFAFVAKARHGVKSRVVVQRPNGSQLQEIADLCEAGAIKPVLDRVFPLEDIAGAHTYSQTARARGKIIVTMNQA